MTTTPISNYIGYRIAFFIAFLFPVFKVALIPSNYAPLIMFPLVFIGAMTIVNKLSSNRITSLDVKVVFLYLYPIFVTFFSLFYFDFDVQMSDILKDIAPPVIGLMMIYGFYQIFKFGGLRGFVDGIVLSSKIVILYGIIEVLTLLGILPEQIRSFVSSITSGVQSGRLQLFTPEASWATMYLAFVFPFFFLKGELSNQDRYFFIPMLLVIYIFAFSFQSFFILVFSSFFYFYFFSKNKLMFISFFLGSVFASCVLVYVTISAVYLGMDDPPYHISRIYKLFEFNGFDFESILLLDGSVFIRIMLPVYSFLIGTDHLLGIGLVFYPYIFDSVHSTLPYSHLLLDNSELVGYMIDKKVDPRNFYFSHLVSGGLVLFLFFIGFSFELIRRVSFNSAIFRIHHACMYLVFYCFGVFFQFGTYAFVPFSFLLGLLMYMEELNGRKT